MYIMYRTIRLCLWDKWRRDMAPKPLSSHLYMFHEMYIHTFYKYWKMNKMHCLQPIMHDQVSIQISCNTALNYVSLLSGPCTFSHPLSIQVCWKIPRTEHCIMLQTHIPLGLSSFFLCTITSVYSCEVSRCSLYFIANSKFASSRGAALLNNGSHTQVTSTEPFPHLNWPNKGYRLWLGSEKER